MFGRYPLFFVAQSFFAFFRFLKVNYLEAYGMERKKFGIRDLRASISIHSGMPSQVVSNFLLFQFAANISDHHAMPHKSAISY